MFFIYLILNVKALALNIKVLALNIKVSALNVKMLVLDIKMPTFSFNKIKHLRKNSKINNVVV